MKNGIDRRKLIIVLPALLASLACVSRKAKARARAHIAVYQSVERINALDRSGRCLEIAAATGIF